MCNDRLGVDGTVLYQCWMFVIFRAQKHVLPSKQSLGYFSNTMLAHKDQKLTSHIRQHISPKSLLDSSVPRCLQTVVKRREIATQ